MSLELPKLEKIVLIHGWISHRVLMKPLEWRLQRAGYATYNWGYRSLRLSIEDHAAEFANYLHDLDRADDTARFHIIAHSMGSIVTRCVLQQHRFANLGRVVMLCPPNRGSHMARRASTLLRRSLRTLDQISDRSDSFVNQLPAVTGKQVGIIIASGDRVVYGDATRLDDAADYAVVPGMHNSVLFKQSVADLCLTFLANGRFTCAAHAAQALSTND